MSVQFHSLAHQKKNNSAYRFALICNTLITRNSIIHTISTPMPFKTSRWEMDQPFFITLRRDSMAMVKGRHLAMMRSPIGMPSSGHTRPLISGKNRFVFKCFFFAVVIRTTDKDHGVETATGDYVGH